MKRRFAVLVVTGPRQRAPKSRRQILESLWLTGRGQNFAELLAGSGMPFEMREAARLSRADLFDDDLLRFSTVMLALPTRRIPDAAAEMLLRAVHDHGLSLIADLSLIKGRAWRAAFGLAAVGRWPRRVGAAKDEGGRLLYRPLGVPHSAQGPDWGIRPLLRMALQNWFARRVTMLPGSRILARYDAGEAAVTAFDHGQGRAHGLNFHPCLVLREGNGWHELLRGLVRSGSRAVAVGWDFEGVALLRMDDPGSAERVHHRGYDQPLIDGQGWRRICADLRAESAHLNVAAVPAWVDDGDAARGELRLGGALPARRIPGALLPAWSVTYARRDPFPPRVYDYAESFAALKEGVAAGLVTILSHGLTHLTPEVGRWLAARDRDRNSGWYREFSRDRADLTERMRQGADWLQDYFGARPRVIVPSGHEHTAATPEMARRTGFRLFSAKTLFDISGGGMFQNRKIRAVYPEEAAEGAALLAAGYPLVLVCHDFDIADHGPGWLGELVREWRERGARRFWSMETLTVALGAELAVVTLPDGRIQVDLDLSRVPVDPSRDGALTLRVEGPPRAVVDGEGEPVASVTSDGKVVRIPLPLGRVRGGRLRLMLPVPDPEAGGS